MLKEGERIDDLQRGGLRIISDPKRFRYGTDAVLLADFVCAPKGACIADLGTGTGILPLLIGARIPQSRFDAIELQPCMCDMAERSAALNGWEDRVRVHCMDLKDAPERLGHGRYDAVTANPPYGKVGSGILPPDPSVALSRFELACTLEDVIASASRLLKNGGAFYMVHQAHRLLEALDLARQYRLAPKRVRLMHPSVDKEAKLLLLECVKNAQCDLRWMPPLVLFDQSGRYTAEAQRIYGGAEGEPL